MDEDVLYPDVMLRPPPPPVPEGEEREMLAKNPFAMLKLTMDRRSRLPEDLHRAMMLWSFHPDYSLCVQSYLELLKIWQPRPSALEILRNGFFILFSTLTKRSLLWTWFPRQ